MFDHDLEMEREMEDIDHAQSGSNRASSHAQSHLQFKQASSLIKKQASTATAATADADMIPCDRCDQTIAFAAYEAHIKTCQPRTSTAPRTTPPTHPSSSPSPSPSRPGLATPRRGRLLHPRPAASVAAIEAACVAALQADMMDAEVQQQKQKRERNNNTNSNSNSNSNSNNSASASTPSVPQPAADAIVAAPEKSPSPVATSPLIAPPPISCSYPFISPPRCVRHNITMSVSPVHEIGLDPLPTDATETSDVTYHPLSMYWCPHGCRFEVRCV